MFTSWLCSYIALTAVLSPMGGKRGTSLTRIWGLLGCAPHEPSGPAVGVPALLPMARVSTAAPNPSATPFQIRLLLARSDICLTGLDLCWLDPVHGL